MPTACWRTSKTTTPQPPLESGDWGSVRSRYREEFESAFFEDLELDAAILGLALRRGVVGDW